MIRSPAALLRMRMVTTRPIELSRLGHALDARMNVCAALRILNLLQLGRGISWAAQRSLRAGR
jgi:hypothetical protein